MKIKDFEFSIDGGFAWIIVEGEKSGCDMTVQCCLSRDDNNNTIEAIKMSDCGHDEGLCADANEGAFNYWGKNRCMTALFNAAKSYGLKVF